MKNYTPSKELKRYTNKLFFLFASKMSLGRYFVIYYYVEKINTGRPTTPRSGQDINCTAEIQIDSRYFDLKIFFSKKWAEKFKKKEYEIMANDMCHELAHVLSDPYYEFFWLYVPRNLRRNLTIINEQQTQLIASAVMSGTRPRDYLP